MITSIVPRRIEPAVACVPDFPKARPNKASPLSGGLWTSARHCVVGTGCGVAEGITRFLTF